jgi:SAM-dependent methyltransferase
MSTFAEPGESRASEASPVPAPPVYFDARTQLAARFLFGEGLEIGPLHQPLAMPPHAKARYVDRMKVDELRSEYPELADWNLTDVNVVDDGEKLATIAPESQDFIVANHFLEHTEDPIRTIETHLSKLRPGGILFYAVPDKRFTFDFRRPPTSLEHMVADYEQGPERSRTEHYQEWTRLVPGEPSTGSAEQVSSEEWATRKARELEETSYSIHMHVWTQAEFLQLILACRERFGEAFDIEAAARVGLEFLVILRKRGPLPPPPAAELAPPAAAAGPNISEMERWKSRARRVLNTIRGDVARWRARP